ncbi:DUF4062 domain-containing protein [Reyranella sp.]|uniref:DUF4062 domain-containing protein n=1 Tax=Reyranella sp. TaxID=1929291 RepID=UPI003BAA3D95
MAAPRVFLSSTCYDLAEVRDSLESFMAGAGMQPCLSEHGDVFFHPDLHTHVSCVSEISNCQLFVLIVGGRFGGKYVADPAKSIVNAEYAAARELGLPVFAFVKREVLDDHRLYQKNKNNKAIDQIEFPSIEKQEHARQIFEFIDHVRLAKTNNGITSFEFTRDIEDLLRKQWAGMLFEALQQRRLRDQIDAQMNVLNKLATTGEQLEQLVKKIYQRIDIEAAPGVIKDVEEISEARDFFKELDIYFEGLFVKSTLEEVAAINPGADWVKFLTATNDFKTATYPVRGDDEETQNMKCLERFGAPRVLFLNPHTEIHRPMFLLIQRLRKSYAAFRKLSDEQRAGVLREIEEFAPFKPATQR